ncbi:hypothetical protein CYMTET_16586 [Cymbomonas tetramitiformis]|uniref:Uncharacterized protein n=1 Tax=Cymbomonas tetramitiformis TaxID=36881 RepID=A0AAE0GD36_9CHLO|nr:hypothetical protein CYMTET_16586 [Cymbomonas tetramitiformis]
MNIGLLDPFQHTNVPEVIEEYLDHGVATCIAFNRRATLLAAGCTSGSIVIWDFDTRGIARVWADGHRLTVTSVSWTKKGYHLLSSSSDQDLVLWDALKGECCARVSLSTAILNARVHPYNSDLCIASPANSAPLLVELSTGVQHPLSVLHASDEASTAGGSLNGRGNRHEPTSTCNGALAFSRRGNLIYIGSNKGFITVIETATREVLEVVKVSGGSNIKGLSCSRNGQHLLVNSGDRTIRVFECKAAPTGQAGASSGGFLRPLREFQNAVNRLQWRAICFSSDSEYAVGGSANKNEHSIHIWNRVKGNLETILEGPPEGIHELVWHPTRPIIASVAMTGKIYLWAKSYTENWSAFAPDFKELEENEEYVEREDEFDVTPADPEAGRAAKAKAEEEEDVDIYTVDRLGPYSDSDMSDDGLHWLPTIPTQDPDLEEAERAGEGEDEDGHAEEEEQDAEAREEEDTKSAKGWRNGEDALLPEGSKRRRVTKKYD